MVCEWFEDWNCMLCWLYVQWHRMKKKKDNCWGRVSYGVYVTYMLCLFLLRTHWHAIV